MNGEIIKKFINVIILNVLSKNDSYGYIISKSIREETNNELDIKDATIYLEFKRMEKDKLIISYWNENINGKKRKYYKITEEGKNYLKYMKKEWVNNRDILDKLILGDKNER